MERVGSDGWSSIKAFHDALESSAARRRDVVEEAIANYESPAGEGRRVFLDHYPSAARAEARRLDEWRGRVVGSPLDGVLISVKDVFDIAGRVTTAGSPALAGSPPAKVDSEVVRRLRAAHAIIIGKTNLSEFAYSVTGTNVAFGTPRNPHRRDIGLLPGGSSSGAAVSVSDRMAQVALGTDTGGSLRVPAALCGLTGYRPSIGRVPSRGMFPLSPSSDTIGAIGRCVDDCFRVDGIIADKPTTVRHDRPSNSYRFVVPRNLLCDDLDEAVARHFARAVMAVVQSGARVVERPIRTLADLGPLHEYGGVTAAEAYRYHSERFGPGLQCIDDSVRARIRLGARTDDRCLEELRRLRQGVIRSFTEELEPFDALLCPTVAITAPTIESVEPASSGSQINQRLLRNTVSITLVGGCAVSIPCQTDDELPVGLMIAAPAGQDGHLLESALFIEHLIEEHLIERRRRSSL
ncbi:MAG: amidase [Candidatus Rokuibacteriota bacterium]